MVRVFRLARLFAVLVLLFGTALHLTVKDGWQPLAVFYYGLPLPILLAGWMSLVLVSSLKLPVGRFCAGMAVVTLGWCLSASYKRNPAPPAQVPALKTLFWNMAHARLPSEDLTAIFEQEKPDIATFVEVGSRWGDPSPLLTKVPQGYQVMKLSNAMAIIVRGKATLVRQTYLPSSTKLMEFRAVVDGTAWKVVIADVLSSPTKSRADSIATALTWAKGQQRTLVMGDFNTPIDSVHFAPWRTEFHHGFTGAGRGYQETWSSWLPVLTIDHVWSSMDAPPVEARKIWKPSSDHAALIVRVKR